jgi:hypothetical protein
MSAAWTEDKAGELVQLVHSLSNDHTREPTKGWAASGQQLIEAFKKFVNPDLADRLRRALEFRNEVIHGVFLPGRSLPLWGSDTGPEWVSMNVVSASKTRRGLRLCRGQWTASWASRRNSPTLST